MESTGTLSKNLSYQEAIRSGVAKRLGINNEPNSKQLHVMRVLANDIFQVVRSHFGDKIYVSSFYRCPKLNEAIGGAAQSDHMIMEDVAAIDLDNDIWEAETGISNADIFYFIYDNLDYYKLIWEFGDSDKPAWVHISYSTDSKKNKRKQTFRAVRDSLDRVSYTIFKDNR